MIKTSSEKQRERRRRRAEKVIIDNVFWAAFLGVVPAGFLSTAATSAIQLKMLNEICVEYDIPFKKQRSKMLIAALVGGVGSLVFAHAFNGVSRWAFPLDIGFGITASLTTYAIGTVFKEHFENDGTLEDFEPDLAQASFQDAYQRAPNVIFNNPS